MVKNLAVLIPVVISLIILGKYILPKLANSINGLVRPKKNPDTERLSNEIKQRTNELGNHDDKRSNEDVEKYYNRSDD